MLNANVGTVNRLTPLAKSTKHKSPSSKQTDNPACQSTTMLLPMNGAQQCMASCSAHASFMHCTMLTAVLQL
jgi:hypothetical protein